MLNDTTDTAVAPAPYATSASLLPTLPPGQLEGIEELGLLKNWVSFDAQRGKMTCRNLNGEYDEFYGTIIESRVVRQMKDEDGNVLCASSNRQYSDSGRPGKDCVSCEDHDTNCFRRWWIAWQDLETGLIFAHTLSQTGSINFHRYANRLIADELLPNQVVTRIFIEEAKRQKTNALYRRIQLERVG